jgi:hypothetical protein
MYNPAMVRLIVGVLVPIVVGTVALAGCASRDVQTDLKLVDVRTGWYDAGLVEGGKNKLVPSVSLKVQNVSAEDISSVEMNAVFRRVGETEVWGEHFIRAIGSSGLVAGQTGAPIVLRSTLGYTGTQSRALMLQNKEFVDARVVIMGRHGSRNWAKMGEYQVDRQLLTPQTAVAR